MKVTRTNTILYCVAWKETVDFYKKRIGPDESYESDWFVEFQVGSSFLSIADAVRATVGESRGDGTTLSWEVPDVDTAHQELDASSVSVSPVKRRWGALVVDFWDPEGHRVELWQSPAG